MRIIIGLALVLATSLIGTTAQALCREDRADIRGDWGSARFRIEVADTPAERAQGLMHVEQLPRMAGMLFVYESPQSVSFWMENTLIPLDMLFFDSTGRLLHIHENAIPLDRTAIPGGSDQVQFVLEINGGMSERLNIQADSELRHPAISDEFAQWPCDE